MSIINYDFLNISLSYSTILSVILYFLQNQNTQIFLNLSSTLYISYKTATGRLYSDTINAYNPVEVDKQQMINFESGCPGNFYERTPQKIIRIVDTKKHIKAGTEKKK